MKFLYYFAFTGLILSLIVGILSFVNIDVRHYIPFVWVLHIGTLIVHFPVVFYLYNYPLYEVDDFESDNRFGLNLMPYLRNAPKKLLLITICVIVVGFYISGTSMNSMHGSPEYENGTYVLKDRGEFIKKITEIEFHKAKASELGMFTGVLILFYSLGFLLLQQIVNYEQSENESD
jgi:hypothetical protein